MAGSEHVATTDMHVEHEAGGWTVVADIDGQHHQFGPAHASKEAAELYAKHMSSGFDRWTGAAEVVQPEPSTYPGDGQA